MHGAGRPGRLWGRGPAALLDVVSLLLLLSAARCGDPHAAPENMSPVINMKLDARKKMLTWNYRRNVTEEECRIDTPPNLATSTSPQVSEDGTHFCEFPNSVLHRGANLTLNVTSEGAEFREVLAFENPGREGSGAVNFSCLIYDLCFLNCSWTPGPAAPADVHYRLYWWASRHDREAECAHYVVDATGTRVGCHLDDLGEPAQRDYFFLVNGTSNETAIRFLDFTPFNAVQMEKYNPPANVTIDFNGSHHVVRWDDPRTRFGVPSHMLCYQLDFQRQGSSYRRDPVFQLGSDDNRYVLPGSAATAGDTLRVRVKHKYGHVWSAWSPTLAFTGSPEQDPASALVALVGLVAGTAALLAVVLMFLCRRFSLRQKLLPPIPQVRVEGVSTLLPDLEIAWDGGDLPPGSQDPEDVLMVEEIRSFASGQAEVVGSARPPDDAESASCMRPVTGF